MSEKRRNANSSVQEFEGKTDHFSKPDSSTCSSTPLLISWQLRCNDMFLLQMVRVLLCFKRQAAALKSTAFNFHISFARCAFFPPKGIISSTCLEILNLLVTPVDSLRAAPGSKQLCHHTLWTMSCESHWCVGTCVVHVQT